MKYLFFLLTLWLSTAAFCQSSLIVTTDIGQDPDDQQSLVRLLHYTDKLHIAGIIANADNNYKHEEAVVKTEIVHELIDAYGKIESNLRIHSPNFPSANYLHSVVKKGCAGNGTKIPVEKYIGKGKDTEGSDWIIKVVDNTSDGWVAVSVWGGACDLAQALWKVKNTRSETELANFLRKLKVYFIGKQDSSNQWIIDNFLQLWLVFAYAESGNSWESTYRGMFLGGDMTITSRDWLNQYIIGKNPLGSLYPDEAWTGNANQNPYKAMKEGDSPSFLYFLPNGLNTPKNPSWGSWGGRFQRERDNFFRDTPDASWADSVGNGEQATVYRWRSDFQNDFAARVQWGAADSYQAANHYPVIQLKNALFSERHIELKTKHNEEILLDASLSFDPDGDSLSYHWFIYEEASAITPKEKIKLLNADSPKVSFRIPKAMTTKSVHLILRVTDKHTTPLVSYKRFVVDIE